MDKQPAAASAGPVKQQAQSPIASTAGAAPKNFSALPLEQWGPEHVWSWRDALYAEHTDNKEKFSEFFDNLPKIANGSTLASYDKSDVEKRFKTDDGRAFGPELYARLQKLKGQANIGTGASENDAQALITLLAQRVRGQALIYSCDCDSRASKSWFVQTFGEDVLRLHPSSPWPPGTDVLNGTDNCHTALRDLLRAANVTVPLIAVTPTWWTNLEKRLNRIERSANLLDTVKKLHANKIFVPNLLEQLFEKAEPLRDRPSTPAQSPQEHYDKAELEAAYGDPVIAASIFLFNKALDQAVKDKNKVNEMSEFDITVKFLALLFDHPISLCGIPMLASASSGIEWNWVRTQPDTNDKRLIPDAQLLVKLRNVCYTMIYVEDKRHQAGEAAARRDIVKSLSLARQAHEAIIKNEKLTLDAACKLILPVVLTRWPKIELYGLYRNTDHTYTADLLTTIDFYNARHEAHGAAAPAAAAGSENVSVPIVLAKKDPHLRLAIKLLAMTSKALALIIDPKNNSQAVLPAFGLTLWGSKGEVSSTTPQTEGHEKGADVHTPVKTPISKRP